MNIAAKLIEGAYNMFSPKTVESSLKQEERRALRTWTEARYSRLGWIFDLEPRLHRIAAPLLIDSDTSEHMYRVTESTPFHFQISGITNRFYPRKPDTSGKLQAVVEQPAALVYSLHPNGSVAVSVSPHKSDWSSFGGNAAYIIGVYPSTNDLAGCAGDAIIRDHIKLFLRLTSLSLAVAGPTKSSAQFLDMLELKTNRYSHIYQSTSEQRRAITQSELALGVGLAAGLVASTLFPMVQAIGTKSAERAQKIKAECKERALPNAQAHELCLGSNDYQLHSFLGTALSTEILLASASLITALVMCMVRNRLKAR